MINTHLEVSEKNYKPERMAEFSLLRLSMLLSLFANVKFWKTTVVPPKCNRVECPTYDVIYSGDGYEIRAYDSPVWAVSSKIHDNSFEDGTRTGFNQLYSYIQGENEYKQKIESTAPVLTEIDPYSGYLVSFYIPKKNQADPPPPTNGITIRKGLPFVAARQFRGPPLDSKLCDEAAALSATLSGTIWADAINKSHPGITVVALYNSEFDLDNIVNEIWYFFDM